MAKNPHANFTPDLNPYSGVGPFRFWCQMALPLTYDDSLSYYELLCKVVNYINNLITDVSTAETNIDSLLTAYNKLQKYVNDYFDDLDIEAELKNVLDRMAESGELDEILSPIIELQLPGVVEDQIDDVVADQINDVVANQIDDVVAEQLPPIVAEEIPDEVTDWLTDNVTPVGSAVVVDSSLTIEGAAADAKTTGKAINNLNTYVNADALNLNELLKLGTTMHFNFVEGCAINSSGEIFDNTSNARKRMSTVDFIDISAARKTNSIPIEDNGYSEKLTYSIETGYRVYVAYYETPSESAENKSILGWISGNGTLEPPYNYMRICMATSEDSTNVTISDAVNLTMSLYPTIESVIDKIVQWGLLYKGTASSSDFNDNTDVGIFLFRSTTHATTAHNPMPTKSGFLMNVPSAVPSSLTPKRITNLAQICVSEIGNDIQFRRVTGASTRTFGNWYKLLWEDFDNLKTMINADENSGLTADNFEVGGLTSSGGNNDNPETGGKRIRTKGYISTGIYNCVRYSVADGYRVHFVPFSNDSSTANLKGSNWLQGDGMFYFPDNTKYYRFQIASIGDTTALATNDYTTVAIAYNYPLNDQFTPIVEQTKWLAIGDSITRGVYSTGTIPDGYTEYSPSSIEEFDGENGWVQQLAGSLGYKLKTIGIRGMGFDSSGHYGTWDDALDAVDALTEDFNLITIAVGTNDYGTQSSSLTDIANAIDAGVARITAKYPEARLIFITPFNRYFRESSTHQMNPNCNASTHWGRGYTYGGKTLLDVADIIKTKCDTYGIECIYVSNNFLFNDFNITRLLPDGVHPSPKCHKLIAKAMANHLLN